VSQSAFTEIDTIRDEKSGVVIVITAREKNNGFHAYSFAVFKEFERSTGGQTQRTSYLNPHHIETLQDLLPKVDARIRQEEERVHAERRQARRA
jgi:hypothetical protein